MKDEGHEGTILVLGIGNVLLTDDGAGVHAMQTLQSGADAALRCVDGGTVGLALAPLIEDADAFIVFDATRLQAQPGTVHVLTGRAMDEVVARRSTTPHEAGLADLMSAVRLQGRLPARRALIGIEPESTEWGTEPTPRVARGVVQAADEARKMIAQWRAESVSCAQNNKTSGAAS